MGTKSHLNLPQSRVTPTDPSSIKDHHLTSHCDPSFDVRLQDSEKESWQKNDTVTQSHTHHTHAHIIEKNATVILARWKRLDATISLLQKSVRT